MMKEAETSHSMQTPVDGHGVTVAPFSVARIGTVSVNEMDGLILTDTVAHLHHAERAEQALKRITSALEDGLYQLVPLLNDDKELRRIALSAKRNIHNLRLWTSAPEDINRLSAATQNQLLRTHLVQWLSEIGKRDAALRSASIAYEEETQRAAQSLARSLKREHLRQSIAFASPEMGNELSRSDADYDDDWKPNGNLARPGLGYLTRAAVKTSPLSGFTLIGLTHFADAAGIDTPPARCQPPVAAPHRVVRLHRALARSCLDLIARDCDMARLLLFELNPMLGSRGPRAAQQLLLKGDYQFRNRIAWRKDAITPINDDLGAVASSLTELLGNTRRGGYRTLLLHVSATGYADAHQHIIQLLDAQIIRPVAPYVCTDRQPLVALAETLERAETAQAGCIAQQMRQLQAVAERYGQACSLERLGLHHALRASAERLFDLFGASVPDWVRKENLIYEDVGLGPISTRLPDSIREDLIQLAHAIRPRILRRQINDYLYEHFVERFGPQGKTSDPLDFLHSFTEREDVYELFGRSLLVDQPICDSQRAFLPCGPSDPPPTLTVMFQVAAASQDVLRRGDYKLVVNHLSPGYGALLARFADVLDADHGGLAQHLGRWQKEICPYHTPAELPISGDWHNLQIASGTLPHVVMWPGETPVLESDGSCEAPQSFRLDELTLKADVASRSLYFADAQGNIITPIYLGTTPPHIVSSLPHLLLSLIEPWTNQYAILNNRLGPFSVDEMVASGSDCYASPRQEIGRVVLQRAFWQFKPDAVPRKYKHESGFDWFTRLERWRVQHALPDEVFVHVSRVTGGGQPIVNAKERKPFWLHFHSPHALELLHQALDGHTSSVIFTEALPTHSQNVLTQETGSYEEADWHDRPLVSEFMSLLAWPKPNASGPVETMAEAMAEQRRRHTHAANWLYLRIYPPASNQLEGVVRDIISPFIHAHRSEIDKWFYLHYADARGAHVRLRLCGSDAQRREWQHELDRLIHQCLPHVTGTGSLPRFLPNAVPKPQVTSAPGYVVATYCPEFSKYGGHAGVLSAERMFHLSSESAVRLHDGTNDLTSDYLALALAMMHGVARSVLHDSVSYRRFLLRYAWYWSGQDRPGAADTRRQLRDFASSRATHLGQQLRRVEQYPAVGQLLQSYLTSADGILQTYAQHANAIHESLDTLCFDFLHTHNNRMGFSMLEEAYMAALLLANGDAVAGSNA